MQKIPQNFTGVPNLPVTAPHGISKKFRDCFGAFLFQSADQLNFVSIFDPVQAAVLYVCDWKVFGKCSASAADDRIDWFVVLLVRAATRAPTWIYGIFGRFNSSNKINCNANGDGHC